MSRNVGIKVAATVITATVRVIVKNTVAGTGTNHLIYY